MPMTGTRWFDCKGDVQLYLQRNPSRKTWNTNRKRFAQGTVDHVANGVDDGSGRGDRRVSDGLDRLDGDVGRLAVIGADAVPLVHGGVQEAPQVLQQTAVVLQRLRSEQILQKKGGGVLSRSAWLGWEIREHVCAFPRQSISVR